MGARSPLPAQANEDSDQDDWLEYEDYEDFQGDIVI